MSSSRYRVRAGKALSRNLAYRSRLPLLNASVHAVKNRNAG